MKWCLKYSFITYMVFVKVVIWLTSITKDHLRRANMRMRCNIGKYNFFLSFLFTGVTVVFFWCFSQLFLFLYVWWCYCFCLLLSLFLCFYIPFYHVFLLLFCLLYGFSDFSMLQLIPVFLYYNYHHRWKVGNSDATIFIA